MKIKLPFARAKSLADKIMTCFAPGCDKIIIAGSIRRECKTIGDIEIVAIPTPIPEMPAQMSMLGEKPKMVSKLDLLITRLLEQKPALSIVKNGDLYKSFRYQIDEDGSQVGIDLFLTTREQWGYILALRTGPMDYSRAFVTHQSKGGLLPDEFRCEGGWLVGADDINIPTPSEETFFDFLGMPCLEPRERQYWAG